MTLEQFRPEHSTRAQKLYAIIKPYIQDDMRFLDIGCAYACLAPLVHADFPSCQYFGFDSDGKIIIELREKHPYYRWERVIIYQGDELKDYVLTAPDFIIHIGIDAAWSAISTVHGWLLQNNHIPKYVLLESGRRDGYEACMTTYNKVVVYYIEHEFKLLDVGRFDFDYDGTCLKDRHYSLLERQ